MQKKEKKKVRDYVSELLIESMKIDAQFLMLKRIFEKITNSIVHPKEAP